VGKTHQGNKFCFAADTLGYALGMQASGALVGALVSLSAT
jgi:hypothetical protein